MLQKLKLLYNLWVLIFIKIHRLINNYVTILTSAIPVVTRVLSVSYSLNAPSWALYISTLDLNKKTQYKDHKDNGLTKYVYEGNFVIKGTHNTYFSSSLYIINQKPMIHRTDFHCITTWVVRFSG